MGGFGVFALFIFGIALVLIGYAFDEKLQREYHIKAPIAFILTGGFLALLAGLTHLRMTYFRKGKFFDYIGVSMVTDMLIRAA